MSFLGFFNRSSKKNKAKTVEVPMEDMLCLYFDRDFNGRDLDALHSDVVKAITGFDPAAKNASTSDQKNARELCGTYIAEKFPQLQEVDIKMYDVLVKRANKYLAPGKGMQTYWSKLRSGIDTYVNIQKTAYGASAQIPVMDRGERRTFRTVLKVMKFADQKQAKRNTKTAGGIKL